MTKSVWISLSNEGFFSESYSYRNLILGHFDLSQVN